MKKEKRNSNIAARCTALMLAGIMALGLAACEADTITNDTEAAETEETGAEETTLEDGEYIYLTMYELPNGIAEAETDSSSYGDDYYIVLVDALTALTEETGEDIVFEDVNGNIVTVAADGTYTSDTGKAIVKTVIVKNGTITRKVTSSVSIEVTNAEDETEEGAEDEEADSDDTDTSSSSSSSSSSNSNSSSSSSSSSSSNNSSSSSSDGNSSSSGYYVEMVWSSDSTSDDNEEEETECDHNWKAVYVVEKTCHYICQGCGEEFETLSEWFAHAKKMQELQTAAGEEWTHHGNTVKTISTTTDEIDYYYCTKCAAKKYPD